MVQKALVACVAFVLTAASARADVVRDPTAGVEAGSFSNPITGLGSFNPSGDPGTPGLIGLFNNTGAFITQLALTTTIKTGLSATTIANAFTCNSSTNNQAPNPFFLNCAINYNSTSGLLSINFFGVNPSTGDEPDANDDEVGEHEGIPPILPSCINTPDVAGCTDVGHFVLVFNNDFVPVTDPNHPQLNNGWTDPVNFGPNGALGNEVPTFNPPIIGAAPEPSMAFLEFGGSALLLLIARRARRRR